MINATAVTVSQLNSYIKVLFESDDNLRVLFISGEISNFKRHYSSGHLYFSLKDDKSVIRAVMFSNDAQNVPFELKDGMNVVVRGRVSCYEVGGQYQVYVKDIRPEGVGAVYMAFEQLKTKLLKEGLFDESIKKPLPLYPQKVGVITSQTGAVIHDIRTVASRRYPLCEIVLYSVEVQGEKSAGQIVKGLKFLNDYPGIDVIIIGRGGGSLEELWAFNKEEVARAIFNSSVPVVSAVGHETDITICDFVADHRAPTPSAAAEIILPDAENIKYIIKDYQKRLKNAMNFKLNLILQDFSLFESRLKKCSPIHVIALKKSELSDFKIDTLKNFKSYLLNKRFIYEIINQKLKLCAREFIFKKGYAVITDNGLNLKSINQFSDNQKVKIAVEDGVVECILSNVKKLKK